MRPPPAAEVRHRYARAACGMRCQGWRHRVQPDARHQSPVLARPDIKCPAYGATPHQWGWKMSGSPIDRALFRRTATLSPSVRRDNRGRQHKEAISHFIASGCQVPRALRRRGAMSRRWGWKMSGSPIDRALFRRTATLSPSRPSIAVQPAPGLRW